MEFRQDAIMTSGYTSDELSHFVGFRHPLDHEENYKLLLTVLASGWVSHPPHEAGWGTVSYTLNPDQSLLSEKLVVPTVTYFCDIPTDKLALHVSKYGLFGIAFSRNVLVKYGARPVTYVPFGRSDTGSPNGSVMLNDIESVYRSFQKHLSDDIEDVACESRKLGELCSTREGTIAAVKGMFEKDFLAFLKPFDADASLEASENFYLEREWRKYGNMKADETTIRTVFVAEGFEDRLGQHLPSLADRIKSLPLSFEDAKTRSTVYADPTPST
jgi:Putative abortive phage resistance protein AbiGi, antitoxin